VTLANSPVNTSEDVGNMTVCVSLIAAANTERSVDLYIDTEAYTATGKLYLCLAVAN